MQSPENLMLEAAISKAVLEGLDKDSQSQQREKLNYILYPGGVTYSPIL